MTTVAAPSEPDDDGKKNDPSKKKINLRRPDIMEAVQAQVLTHYRSELVERIRASGGVLSAGELTVKLAKEFAGGQHAATGADAFNQFAAVMGEHLGLHRFHDVRPAKVDFLFAGVVFF